jgi:hypothetical protein
MCRRERHFAGSAGILPAYERVARTARRDMHPYQDHRTADAQ